METAFDDELIGNARRRHAERRLAGKDEHGRRLPVMIRWKAAQAAMNWTAEIPIVVLMLAIKRAAAANTLSYASSDARCYGEPERLPQLQAATPTGDTID